VNKFADNDLGFSFADEDHAVAEAYGVWVEKSMYGRTYWGNERTTFVIDPDGRAAEVLRKVKPAQARWPGPRRARDISDMPSGLLEVPVHHATAPTCLGRLNSAGDRPHAVGRPAVVAESA
jgi:AhpC/TSA family